jgi:hypothetical protein
VALEVNQTTPPYVTSCIPSELEKQRSGNLHQFLRHLNPQEGEDTSQDQFDSLDGLDGDWWCTALHVYVAYPFCRRVYTAGHTHSASQT